MKRVLFVDDEARVLDGLRDLMHRHRRRWEMVFALGGEAGLAEIRRQPFDVIISDMRMPGMDGAALLGVARVENPQAVRIVLSGFTDQDATLRAVPVAHQFLTKPCEAELLEATIERACSLGAMVGHERLRRLVGGIDTLPPRPSVYGRLLEQLALPGTTSADIARLLEADLTICAKMMQVVNSSFFGIPRRITRIEEAVSYLGHAMILNLALSMSTFTTPAPVRGLDLERLQRHAMLSGALARHIVSDRVLADDAFLAGMLHDIGILVFAAKLPEWFDRSLERMREVPRPLHEVEDAVCGVTHAELGAYLLGLWALPLSVVEAVAYHHAPERAPAGRSELVPITHIASLLAQEATGSASGVEGAPVPPIDEERLAALGMRDELPHWRELAREIVTASAAAA